MYINNSIASFLNFCNFIHKSLISSATFKKTKKIRNLPSKSRLDSPIVSGTHLRKISDRTSILSADNAERFITTRKIHRFENLAKFTATSNNTVSQIIVESVLPIPSFVSLCIINYCVYFIF